MSYWPPPPVPATSATAYPQATSLDPYFLYQRIAVALERIADALDRESAAPVPELKSGTGS